MHDWRLLDIGVKPDDLIEISVTTCPTELGETTSGAYFRIKSDNGNERERSKDGELKNE